MKKVTFLRFVFFVLFTAIFTDAYSQNTARKNVVFPDISGYKTLKCDFHAHTILSDGWVTPEYRVQEAWIDGLDVLAITDHLDSHGRVKTNKQEKKVLYEKAYAKAKELGIVLIPGTELSRSLPTGHYNLLFIRAFGSIKEGPYISVLKKARKQGAFLEWNHPGWTQPKLLPVWYKEQENVFKKKLMNGMEIINEHEYYPLAFQWCLDKNITIIGNSDIHDSTKNAFNPAKGKHRPMTLVFAANNSLKAIKEALLAKRTSVYNGDSLYGNKDYLLPLFYASVTVPDERLSDHMNKQDKKGTFVTLKNNSSFLFILQLAEKVPELELPAKIVIKPLSETEMKIGVQSKFQPKEKDFKIKFKVLNLFTGPGENPVVEIPVHIKAP